MKAALQLPKGPVPLALGVPLLLALLAYHLSQGEGIELPTAIAAIGMPDGSRAHELVRTLYLPRTLMGLLGGAALGIAGTLLQTVARNPLASPATLGVNAGAYLAVVLAAIAAPGLFAQTPVWVAFAGGMGAALLVYVIAASTQVTPLRLALAGVAVSLALASLTATLQLFFETETQGLFLWGAGTLVQTGWQDVTYTVPKVAIGAAIALLLARSLDVLLLGDEVARSLGQRVALVQSASALLGVFLAATVTGATGPIGFVGLVAPHLVRLMGGRAHVWLLPSAAVWGAIVLVAADVLARTVTTNLDQLPAGSVTALIGGPFLVGLARYTDRLGGGGSSQTLQGAGAVRWSYRSLVGIAAFALLSALAVGMALGDLMLAPAELLEVAMGRGTALHARIVLELRLPRLMVAALAGASLAVSGLLLQGVVRNPLAGPEIVGVTSGAELGALLVLVGFPQVPLAAVPLAAMGGAFAAFGVTFAAAWRNGLSAARFVLVGIAVSAFCAAGTQVAIVAAKLRAANALVWLAGSTYARTWQDLEQLAVWPLALLPLAWGLARWLDLLVLGEDWPQALGLSLQQSRALLLLVAVALAAAAVSVVGTVGFVGLMAPHLARLLVGTHHRKLVPLVALVGATLVVGADALGRTMVAPREIPSGLVTAAIGTPYFLWLLWRTRTAVRGS